MISAFGLAICLAVGFAVGFGTLMFYSNVESWALSRWAEYLKSCQKLAEKMFFTLDERKIFIWTLTPCILFGVMAWKLTTSAGALSLLFVGLGMVFGAQILRFALAYLWTKRLDQFDDQLTDALNLLANSLKSGLNLNQAIEVLVEEMPQPISQEFSLVLSQEKVGLTLDESLEHMIVRVPSDDLAVAVHSVLILRETGGDLAETFETISQTIRERRKVDGKIKSMTAQGRTQGYILLCMPFGFAAFLYFTNPGYLSPLIETKQGWMLIFAMLMLQVVGYVWVRKLIKIEI